MLGFLELMYRYLLDIQVLYLKIFNFLAKLFYFKLVSHERNILQILFSKGRIEFGFKFNVCIFLWLIKYKLIDVSKVAK